MEKIQMRHGTSSRRQRSGGGGRGRGNNGNNGGRRSGGGNGGQKRSQVYDSNGPDVRIRGTAHQVFEKYLTLSKDCSVAGDIVLAESYMQHAEHYQRIINSWVDDAPRQENKEPKQDQGQSQEKQVETQAVPAEEPKAKSDDLSLPASILGDDVKVEGTADDQGRTAALSEA